MKSQVLLLLFLSGCNAPQTPNATPAPTPGTTELSSVPPNTERLIQGEKTFIGYQISPSEFRTCAGPILNVGTGIVQPTTEACSSPTPPPVMLMKKVTVTDVNPDQNTFVVRTAEGNEIHTFIPPGSGIDAKKLQVNKQITLHTFSAPNNAAWWRAEKVEPPH